MERCTLRFIQYSCSSLIIQKVRSIEINELHCSFLLWPYQIDHDSLVENDICRYSLTLKHGEYISRALELSDSSFRVFSSAWSGFGYLMTLSSSPEVGLSKPYLNLNSSVFPISINWNSKSLINSCIFSLLAGSRQNLCLPIRWECC